MGVLQGPDPSLGVFEAFVRSEVRLIGSSIVPFLPDKQQQTLAVRHLARNR